jgi:Holliday junction resolvasome RuvABC DNA-binding subunit
MLAATAQRWTKADTEKLRAILKQKNWNPSEQGKDRIEAIRQLGWQNKEYKQFATTCRKHLKDFEIEETLKAARKAQGNHIIIVYTFFFGKSSNTIPCSHSRKELQRQ